jgi:hypothetical protein
MTKVKLIELNGNEKQKQAVLKVTYAQGEAQLTIPVGAPVFHGEPPRDIARRAAIDLLGALQEWAGSHTELE